MPAIQHAVRQQCDACGFIGSEHRMSYHFETSEHATSTTITVGRNETEKRRRARQRRRERRNNPLAVQPQQLERKLQALRSEER